MLLMFKPAVSLNLSSTEMMYEVPQENLPSKVCWIVEDIGSQGATEQRQKPRTLRLNSQIGCKGWTFNKFPDKYAQLSGCCTGQSKYQIPTRFILPTVNEDSQPKQFTLSLSFQLNMPPLFEKSMA